MEDLKKLAEFQEKIDADIKIEPRDWMPEKYIIQTKDSNNRCNSKSTAIQLIS